MPGLVILGGIRVIGRFPDANVITATNVRRLGSGRDALAADESSDAFGKGLRERRGVDDDRHEVAVTHRAPCPRPLACHAFEVCL